MTAALVIACVGVALEVAFTAATEPAVREGWRLQGRSYVWMFPIYALAVPFLDLLRPWSGGGRGTHAQGSMCWSCTRWNT